MQENYFFKNPPKVEKKWEKEGERNKLCVCGEREREKER